MRAAFVKLQAAAFEAEYVARRGDAIHDTTESMLMKAPPPLRASTGANACVLAIRLR